ncbi:MAG: NAD(P)-dependent oxidoreductase [Pseudodesulfovibrio sp.]|nr:NAD(P)-dependent oxidoreductase [Pseudodesulfovibrio sp.]
MNKKILVTGAKGFIGSAFTQELERRGVQWVPFDGDVCRQEDFSPYEDCSSVMHLAGKVRVDNTPENMLCQMDTNIMGAYNSARFAAERGCAFYYASSCSYDPRQPLPSTEAISLVHSSPYSFTKYCAEVLIEGWVRYFDLRGVIFRIFNVYGPGQSRGFVVPDLLSQVEAGRVSVYNLEDERDFVFVDDVANLMATAVMVDHESTATINVGSGLKYSISEVLEAIFKLTGTSLPVEDRGIRSAVPQSQADISRALGLFDWTPKVALPEGLARTISEKAIIVPSGEV